MNDLGRLLRNRDFAFYWVGVVVSQLGTRATQAACLYHVYALSGSISITGLVGLAQGLGVIVLSPLGGVWADRLDRRRLLQASQAFSLLGALALAVLTFAGEVRVWHILASVLLITAAATFDKPARIALLPALVSRDQLPEAVALVNPSRELAVLVGPALGGVLIAVGGPGWVYLFDVATYAVLVVLLFFVRTAPLPGRPVEAPFFTELREGARYVTSRPLLVQLIALDVALSLFGAYRVVLPALATDVFHVGPTGYGILAAAPSAGALLATWTVFRIVKRGRRQGMIAVATTMSYGVVVVLFGQAPVIWLALLLALALGWCDAVATTIRQSAVQLDTPDHLRGRVSSLYQVASNGGPSLGQVVLGALASALGPAGGLAVGGLVTFAFSASFLVRPNAVTSYDGARREAARAPG
ncbi:MFS transporter [Asanoa iriomotensis]|uniref:MFS transporter n=1 Tax=Asanoa iriomotensis TaxID=234613 RepID=A0ABQ4C555_9ACTN|nr:MFS transporter [Asanoa iriomotensis]GIF57400.1 MFS transporter [Asanoa iriomotensis]